MSAVYRGTFADASLLSQQQAAVQRVLHAQEQARRVIENTETMPPSAPFIPAGIPVFTPNRQRPQEQPQTGTLLSHLFGSRPHQNQGTLSNGTNQFQNQQDARSNAASTQSAGSFGQTQAASGFHQNSSPPDHGFAATQNQSGSGPPFHPQAQSAERGFMPPFAQGAGRQGATGGGRGLLDLLGSLTSKIPGVSATGSPATSLGDSLKSTLSSVSQPLASLLDTFDIDGEKLIILMVMWVIFNERGDKTLLLALGYLLF